MDRTFENLDAAESAFFLRQLEHIKSQVYPVLYPELKGRQLIPVNTDAGDGVDLITYREEDTFGAAKVVTDYADDLPYADTKGTETSQRVRDLGVAFRYSVREIKAAAHAGVDLTGRKAQAARRACEFKLDDIASAGDSVAGLKGLLNHSSISHADASALTWADETADAILGALNEPISTIRDATNGVHGGQCTFVLPEAQYTLIATKRMPDFSNETVLSFFLRTNPFVREVFPWYKCKGAGATSTDRMLVYERNPDVLTLEVPADFQMMEPQAHGLSFTVPCRLVTAGVILYRPKACLYRDGI